MADNTAQQHLFDVLMERVTNDRYPSLHLLDRLEEIMWTSEQVVAYTEMLVSKIDESWYPSGQLLDRAQRVMSFAAPVAVRSSGNGAS